jgi:predicted Zn-dependent peptidase
MIHKKSIHCVFIAQFFFTSASKALELEIEQDSRLPLAYVNLVVTGGAVSDPHGKSGITSFMGEMLTRGSRKHTKEQIDLLLDQWGAQLGVETRAEYIIIRGAVLSRNW